MRFLVIQTAFIGDVILATAIVEKLHSYYPEARIDFLLRKGNESLLRNNPGIHHVLIWNKKSNKYRNLIKLIRTVRKNSYDYVINLQRYFSSGLTTALSGANTKIGFDKNPLSFLFTKSLPHNVGNKAHPVHEVERNQTLVQELTDNEFVRPKLYPEQADFDMIKYGKEYISIAPSSVWFTKQLPVEKWNELIEKMDDKITVYLIGSSQDIALCNKIEGSVNRENVENLAGKLTFLESAALMKNARMNYVNDSAPLHIASSVNAPCTAVFCSTIPEFGFGPLSDVSAVIEVEDDLNCRPCGLHGKRKCPEGHFNCSKINISKMIDMLMS